MTQNFSFQSRLSFLVMLVCMSPASASLRAQTNSGAGQQIHWTQLGDAQLKLDSKPPLAWAVYQPDKKSRKKGSDLVLVLVGHRYLMIDLKTRLAYLVFPSD